MTTTAPRRIAAQEDVAEIDVVVSDDIDDIDDALRLIHDGFVAAGYSAPYPSGRRMHPSYLNPGTVFFVARIDGVPAGTCALIADGPFGLPSDRAFAEENDQIRAEGLTPHECGSLAVRTEARRHTRHVLMHVIAAMARHALQHFPEAPVPMAVTPESERFYGAVVGARHVAGPRPLYGAPAALMRTSGVMLAAHCAQRTTSSQRMMDDLVQEPSPAWLRRRPDAGPLPPDYLIPLLEEQGVAADLAAQVELLAARHPTVLARLLAGTATVVTA